MAIKRPLLSTGLFASPSVRVDDILVQDGLAARVPAQRVLRPSADVTAPDSSVRTPPTSGPPGRHIGRQSNSTQHAVTASAGRTQNSGRSGDHRLDGQ